MATGLEPAWCKSSYSADRGNCVQIAHTTDGTLMRDTQDTTGPCLSVRPGEWSALIALMRD
ncbi:DUF397 domain-containing protein [Nocardiopsis sp. TNDT3]|uniref:DUF397 domain-containing protein n=1 Tax=Nocardiopsis sp. TNDT3 TaxID=2249354 RepID=UPI000E3E714D|nr:DUF397 domain-containing protein [Nocardiopsis sp. TNDT3]